MDRSWFVEGYPFSKFRLVQSVFFSASMATLSLFPLTLDITSLNRLINSRRGSSSLWDRQQRSTSDVSLSMNIEYCLRNSDASWPKLLMEFCLRRANHSSAAPSRFLTNRRQ